MNYANIYNKIIENAKIKNNIDNKYYEVHHIIPKCLGGSDNKENLVKLTLREHYVCHKLLAEIYKDNKSIWHAYWMMTISTIGALENIKKENYFRVDGEQLRRIKPILEGEKIIITSREYEYCREYWRSLIRGVKRNKEQLKNISNGTKIGMQNAEVRKKCGAKNKGSKHYYNPITNEHFKWFPGDPDIDLTIYKWGRGPISNTWKKNLSKTQLQNKTLCKIKDTNFRYLWYKDYIKQIPDCLEDLNVKQNNSLKSFKTIFNNVLNTIKYNYEMFLEDDLLVMPNNKSNLCMISPSVIEICYDLIKKNILNENELAKRIIDNIEKIKELNKIYICENSK